MAKNDPKISYSYAFCYVEFTKSRQRYKKIFIYARERECIREFYTKCVNFYTLEKGAKRNSIKVETRLKVGNDQHKSTFGKNGTTKICSNFDHYPKRGPFEATVARLCELQAFYTKNLQINLNFSLKALCIPNFCCTFAADFILAECAHANRRFEYTVRRAPGNKGDR